MTSLHVKRALPADLADATNALEAAIRRFKQHLRGEPDFEWVVHEELVRVEKHLAVLIPDLREHVDFAGMDVLDVGCGSGSSAVALALSGARSVLGVDPHRESLRVAVIRCQAYGVERRVRFAQALGPLPVAAASIDLCVVNGVLQYVPALERPAYLREFARVLRPGGWLFIGSTPNAMYPVDLHCSRGARDNLRSPSGTIEGLSYPAVERILREAGLLPSPSPARGTLERFATRQPEGPPSALRAVLRSFAGRTLAAAVPVLARLAGRPAHTFLPWLNVAFRKS